MVLVYDPSQFFQRKSYSDFQKEAEEEKVKKKAAALAEKSAELGILKAEKDLQTPAGAFSGDSWDAQVGNVAYEKFLADGLDPMTAKQAAADAVLRTKMDYKLMPDPENPYGPEKLVPIPRAAIFGGAPEQSDYNGMDPMVANQKAAARRVSEMGAYNPNAAQPYDIVEANVLPLPDVASVEKALNGGYAQEPSPLPRDKVLNMPAAQGAAVDRGQYGPYIDPRAMASPDVQKDLARKKGEQEIAANDPKFLAEQQEKSEKAARAQSMRKVGTDVVQRNVENALKVLNEGNWLPVSGTLGDVLSYVRESPAGRLKSYLKPLESAATLESMLAMKQSSPTGATGFGPQSNWEGQILAQRYGELSVQTDPEILKENLVTYHNDLMNFIHGTPEEIIQTAPSLGLSPEEVKKLTRRLPESGGRYAQYPSVEAVEAADLPKGSIVYINGRKAIVE